MTESSGSRLAARHRWLVAGGMAGVTLGVLVAIASGDYLYVASIGATIAVLMPVLVVLQRNHNRHSASAQASGAFGATCNVYFENVKNVPRFRPLLGDFGMPWWVRLPSTLPRLERSVMGGALLIDRSGIVWTPSRYRQRKGMPTLGVPLHEVTSVAVRHVLSIGRGGFLEVRLRDGGDWLLSMQDSDEALTHLVRLGCQTTAP